ncbi:NAD(P)-binding protein [Rhizophagus irregularis]|uniref:NAD(P)-binding protein n=1 Tax=Rhizophagus irregularis TaxID=588596 RepID=A0A2N0RT82_9GLOM|nr:NAD(P)-binding protein [Rhizophagus irregularis]
MILLVVVGKKVPIASENVTIKQITVVLTEGSQGGSVVNALLATGLYKIRALTRNPNFDKAKALKAKGVDEVVKCDLSNKEDIKNALSGADIAWIVTNYWDPLIIGVNPGEEERQGKLIADAAKEVGFNWLIYSSLPDSTTESDGKYPAIIHLSGKNRVEQYIRSLGIPNTTFVYLSYYYQNLGISAPFVDKGNEVEPIVAKIIEERPAKWNGKKVPVAAESVGLKHLADVLTKVTGKTHKIRTLNDDDIKEFSFIDTDELKQMHKWFIDYGLFGKDNELKDISIAKKLHPKIKSFEQYAIETYPKA